MSSSPTDFTEIHPKYSLTEESKESNRKGSDRKASMSIKKMILPKLRDESKILNLECFGQIINSLPELYPLLEWKLLFSNKIDGTSFGTLLRKAKYNSPFILLIKDDNNFVFGSYGNDALDYSNDYYGSGETFLFTFRDLEEISTFYWTKKNSLFISVDDQGIIFGSAPKYGLWINNDLTRGRTFNCQTFENTPLSYHEEFQIMTIELWTIIDPFTSN